MKGVLRPCIERDSEGRGCPQYAKPGCSRCAECQAELVRKRERSPSSRVAWTARWKRLRASVIAKRRRADGTWLCEVCMKPILSASDIQVDHIVPVSDREDLAYAESNLRVAHEKCNKRLGGLTAAAQRQRRSDESRIGQALRSRRHS